MIKFLLVLSAVIFLSACSYQEEATVFSVNDEQKTDFLEQINKQLKLNLWNYSENDISYEQGFVPDEENEKYAEILNASVKMGFDFSSFSGEEATVASVELLHFNNDPAGTAYFYFVDENIVCQYYTSSSRIYALAEVNVFLSDKKLDGEENNDIKRDFEEKDFEIEFDDFSDISVATNKIAVIKDGTVNIYKYDSGFVLYKVIDYSSRGIYPVDLAFDENGNLAVLYGEMPDGFQDELSENATHYEYDDFESAAASVIDVQSEKIEDNLKTTKIILFNDKFEPHNGEILLNLGIYTAIDYKEETIFAVRGKSVDVFKKQGNGFVKQKQIGFKQWLSKLKIVDLDNDGNKEAVAIDGANIYVYSVKDNFELMWSTHLSMQSMDNIFYVADLNGDGMKEIYISDNSLNTTAKYEIASFGFNVSTVEYGFEYIVGDLNGDGKEDYITKNTTDFNKKLYIAK